MKKLFYKNFIWLSLIYFIGGAVENAYSVILLPFYTYYLSPFEFGMIAIMNVTIGLATNLVSTPLASATSRFYFNPEFAPEKNKMLFNMFILLLLKSTIVAVLYYLAADFLSVTLLSDSKYIGIIKYYGLLLFLTPIHAFSFAFIRLIGKAKLFVIANILNLIFSCSITIFMFKLGFGVYAFITGKLAIVIIATLTFFPQLLKHFKYTFSLSSLKSPLRYGYPLIFEGYSYLFIQSGDRYVIKFLDNLDGVGIYTFGYKIASIIDLVFINPVKNALVPIVFKAEGNPKEQKEFLYRITVHYYMLIIFGGLLISLFCEEVLQLFPKFSNFQSSLKIIPVIVFAYILQGMGNFFSWGLVMSKKSSHLSGMLIFSAILNLGLNFIFIPSMGILGAAFATLISYIVWNFLKIYYSSKFYNLKFDHFRLIKITLVGLSLYMAGMHISSDLSIIKGSFIKILALACYPILIYFLGIFRASEISFIKKQIKNIRENSLETTLKRIKG